MEGAREKVRRKSVGRALRFALVFSVLSVTGKAQIQGRSDFLVLEHPGRLVVYNKYQQAITERERTLLAAFVPMRVLKAEDVLGDGFTRCVQVGIDDEVFFLLKDPGGALARSGPLGFETTYRHAALVLDTVRILLRHSIQSPSTRSTSRTLSTGIKLIRIFRSEDAIYCRTSESPPTYGWVDFKGMKEGSDWIPFDTASPAEPTTTDELARRVRARIDRVNDLLERLFDHFNKQTNDRKPVPHWNVTLSHEKITCSLEKVVPQQFEQSSVYLAKDLENAIMGSGRHVSYTPGRIEIMLKR